MKHINYRTPAGKEYSCVVSEDVAEELAKNFAQRIIMVVSGTERVYLGLRDGKAAHESVPATFLINPDNIVELTIRESNQDIKRRLGFE